MNFQRAKSRRWSWREILLITSLFAAPPILTAQITTEIIQAEYFFDTDPGFGSGTSIPTTPGSSTLDTEFTVDVSSLPTGVHRLYVRVQERRTDAGVVSENWSLVQSRTFYLAPGDPAIANSVVEAEYFFDTDPGFGSATSLGLPADLEEFDISQILDISELEPGFHTFNLRVKDAYDSWSLTTSRPIIVASGNSIDPEPILAAEYFFDTDPGVGQATPINVETNTGEVELDLVLDIGGLTSGIHHLAVRTQDSAGNWSLTHYQSFLISTASATGPVDIVAAEYFFDEDPGFEQGEPCPFTPSGGIDENFIVSLVGLESGEHTLYIRVQDSAGNWSLTHTQTFTADLPANAPAFVVRNLTEASATIVEITGEPVTFGIRGDGDGDLTYQWTHNGNPVAGATSSEIAFSPDTVTLDDAGTYIVTVSNAFGSETSEPFTLTVKAAPRFLLQPESLTVIQGEAASFSSSVYGSETLSYVWLKDQVPLDGQDEPGLTIDSAQPSDAGEYQLLVSNDVGSAESVVVSLTVLIPPTITDISGAVQVYETQSFTLQATATGTGPLAAQWIKDGADLAEATSLTYTVNNASLTDSGAYTLRVTNDAGENVSDPVQVQVLSLPDLEISGITWLGEAGFQFEIEDVLESGAYVVEFNDLHPDSSWEEMAGISISVESIPGTDRYRVIFIDSSNDTIISRFYRVRRLNQDQE